MKGLQLNLFDAGPVQAFMHSAAADDSYTEEVLDLEAACDAATAYGRETARTCASYPILCRRLAEFVDGLATANDFDRDECEVLRNCAFAAADPIMQQMMH